MRVTQLEVKLKFPFVGEIAGTWTPSEQEKAAAWELYAELVTRVSVQKLPPGEGVMREALNSLYTLFESTRLVLRTYGPSVAPRDRNDVTFGMLAIGVLNGALRPLLTKWHPALQAWEGKRPPATAPQAHEQAWDQIDALRADVESTRRTLAQLARILADVAGAQYLYPNPDPDDENPSGSAEQ